MKKIADMTNPYSGHETAVFVPEKSLLVLFEEGIGENLLPEDIENGYVDYVNYETYSVMLDTEDLPDVETELLDGGMVLFKNYVREMPLPAVAKTVLEDVGASLDDSYHWDTI